MKDWSKEFGRGGMNRLLDADSIVAECGLDREEIEWRKDFIGFDETDEAHLSNLEGLFREHTDEIADGFYDNLTDYEQTVEVISRSDKAIDQLKRTQSAYLVTLASGDYGMEYLRDRARIGKIHDLLDMPMKHYLGQYGVYYDLIFPLLFERIEERLIDRLTDGRDLAGDGGVTRATPSVDGDIEAAVSEELDRGLEEVLAVLRAINLDMQVVADTYIHSYNEELQESIEARDRLMREVEEDLAGPIEELQSSADTVAESADEISGIARDQADSMEEVGGEVANMSATVEEIASTADEVAATSKRAEELATEGREAATETIDIMERIDDSSRDVAAQVIDSKSESTRLMRSSR